MKIRYFISAVAFSLLLVAGTWYYYSARSPAQQIVENWAESATGLDFITLSNDGISHDRQTNVTTIRNLKIQVKIGAPDIGENSTAAGGEVSYTLFFPTIAITDLAFENGYMLARAIRAETGRVDFSVTNGGIVSAGSIGTLDEFVVNNVRWAQLPEIGSGSDVKNKPISKYFPLLEAILDVSFDNAAVKSVTLEQKLSGAGISSTTRYGRIEIAKTVRGNFSRMTIADMAMELGRPSGSDTNADAIVYSSVNTGRIVARDYNYRNLLDAIAAFSADNIDKSPPKPFLAELSVEDVAVKSTDISIFLDTVKMNNVTVQSPKTDLLAQADRLFLAANSANEKPDERELVRLAANTYGIFQLGEFAIEGLQFDLTSKGKRAGKGSLDAYRITGFSAAGIAEMTVSGVNFEGQDVQALKLENLTLTDMKFPPLASLMKPGSNLNALPTLAKMEVSGAKLRIGEKEEYALDRGKLEMAGFVGPTPTNIQLGINGLIMPVRSFIPRLREILAASGYEQLEISHNLKANWQEEIKELNVKSDIYIENAGYLDVEFTIGDVPRRLFEKPQLAAGALTFATIKGAKLILVDGSFVEKGLTAAGARQSISAQEMKEQFINVLPILMQKIDNPFFVNEVTGAVNKFLEQKGSITVLIRPQSPILLLQLLAAGATSPGTAIGMLNISVEAK